MIRSWASPRGESDTLNAIGLMAAILEKEDPKAIFAVLTADHIIEPDSVFKECMDLGFRLVEDDPRRLVTFSIKPTYAATGFGYVERGSGIRGVEEAEKLAYHVARFVEKPDKPLGRGVFPVGRVLVEQRDVCVVGRNFLEAVKQYKPESYEGRLELREAWEKRGFKRAMEKIYPTLPKDQRGLRRDGARGEGRAEG